MSRQLAVISMPVWLSLPGCLWVSDAELAARLKGKEATETEDGLGEGLGDGLGDEAGTPAEAVDADGDGSPASLDCDDDDPQRTPGADEICDGIDNDCDGRVDAEAIDMSTWYADSDGDGFVDADSATPACEAPAGHFPQTPFDCDDRDGDVHPEQLEVLGDGLDQNCDEELGPALVPVPALSGPERAPVVLHSATRDDAETVVLAWLSARCGEAETMHLCGGTLAWAPEQGETWAEATADDWSRPEYSAKTVVSFSYSELFSPTWGWISHSGERRSAHISARPVGGDFDLDQTQTASWNTSAETRARVDVQSFDVPGGDAILGLICDETAGLFHTRQTQVDGEVQGFGFDADYRSGLCTLSQSSDTRLMLQFDEEVHQLSWGGYVNSDMDLDFHPVDLSSTASHDGIGLHAVLGSEELLVQRCNSYTSSYTVCDAAAHIAVAGGLRAELAYEPVNNSAWACVVHEDGSAAVLHLTDLSTSAAESWTLAGVSEATSCAVAVLPTGTLVAAVNTADEVLVAQADIAGLL